MQKSNKKAATKAQDSMTKPNRKGRDGIINHTLGLSTRSRTQMKNSKDSNASNAIGSMKTVKRSRKGRDNKQQQVLETSVIESIHDFKLIKGEYHYLVHRSGSSVSESVWEKESLIGSCDVLKSFQNKVHVDSGYSMTSTDTQQSVNQRPSRASKIKAVINIKSTIRDSIEVEEDKVPSKKIKLGDEDSKRSGKGSTNTKSSPLLKKERQEQEEKRQREERKQARAQNETLVLDLKEMEDRDIKCCIVCSIGAYRVAVKNNNMDALRELFTKKDTIPIWSDEDCLHYGDQVLSLAILKGNVDAVELLIKNNTRGYIKVPEKYVNHQSNTGYIGISTFGHAIRTVSESRGNREGDAAFYRRTTDNPMEIDTNKCLKSDIFAKNIMSCTHELPSLSERNIIDSMMMAEPNIWNGVAIYFLAASGNYLATASIIEGKFDPTWYNHLHISTLSFVNNEDLPTYRRNQITKKLVSGGSLTPLECSAINPSARYLKELFEKAEPHERVNLDDYGRNVSHFSAANEAPECIEYLISQGFNMSTGDKYRLTPLLQAARFGRHRNIKPLLMYLAQEEFPSSESADYTLLSSKTRALHYAAYYGHTETCLALIECGATIEAVETKTKSTPLIFAAQRGHVECVRLLLQRGANIEARDKFSRNPLHLAVKSGHYEVVYHLLEQGADANVLDTSCNTPAHYAAAFGYIKVLQLLIVYGGADPTLENAWKRSPCAIANLKGHTSVVQYLLSQTHKMVDVNFKDENGNSMIHQCVSDKIQSQVESDNNLYKIRMLLMRGANPNLTNIKLETPLHCLAKSPYFKNYFPEKPNGICFDEMIGIEYHQKLVDILTGAGADINIENRYEETPLAVAMHNKNHIVVKALIQKGAQYWIDKDRSGNNFFHYFLSSAAFIDGRPTFISVNRISRNRLTEALEEVYQSVLEHPAEKSLLDDLANAVNDEGYTPFIQSVFMALKYQEERISANKERVKQKVVKHQTKLSHYMFATPVESEEKSITVSFIFNTKQWLIFAERFIGLCKSDFNATVQLPKSFMEENPKAKISDYPENVGYGALQLAAVGQDEELLEFLLLQGCDPNQVITTKKYPRATALSIGYAKKRENLLEYLPDKSLQTIEYAKKLFNIRKPDFGELQSDFVKLFAKYGVNPCIPEKEGVTALMNSARSLDSTLLSYLCESATNLSADIDTKDDNERTALMYALDAFNVAFKSNERLNDITPFLHLLSSGANFNMLYQDENTVLMKAIRAGIPCIVNALLSHSKHPVDWDIENRDKETVLILAFKSKNTDIVQRCIDYALPVLRSSIHIVNHCDEQQNNILALSARNGYTHLVALLLECNADPNISNSGSDALFEAIKNKHVEIIELLLKAGANVNQKDSDGTYLLHHAVNSDKLLIVKSLLDYGADVSVRNKRGQTSLHLAIEKTKHHINASFKIEKILLDAGADINAADDLGRVPLHIAFTPLNIIPHMQKTFFDYDIFIRVKKNDDELKKKEEIVNHYTKKYGSRDLKTNKWIEDAKRKSLTQKDESKNMDAEKSKLERYGNFEWERSVGPCFKSDHINIVKFLSLSKDILYDIHDCFGRTPIHYSACTGAFSCTSFLLEKDINIDAEDEDKNTPLHLALLYGYIDYSIMLCNRGANVSRDIFIPDGQVVTLIHYTLSAGFMNLAYLILDKDIKALEFIRDALRTGKFELADMLLHSINDSTILESITSEQQNLWHTISCFIPYDFEVWNEYILGFLDIFSKVDLKMGFDVYGRSPAHYAAMNHQEKMLSTIIQSKLCSLGVDDKDGNSELYYAVLSNSTGCVKMLLGAGVSTSHSVDQTRKSLVLMATEHKNIEMLKMLLDSGIEVRNDEQFEKAGAITVACLNNTIEILKLLIQSGTNLDVISTIYTNGGYKYYHKCPPLFTASFINDLEPFKILLEAGANPNAISNSFSSKGHTKSLLFMSLSNRVCDEKLHLLLKHKVDLNTTVVDSQRSIFYQYYFDLKRKVEHKIIYENMLQYSLVDINVVDSVTKATPLEIAIRENNAIIVERLLEIEANPNIESCKVLREKEYSLYSDKVNAIFHTILQNQPAILILIHEKSRHPVNWFAQDEQGRTILVRLINGTHEYSYESEQMLTNIHNIMGEKFFDLLKIPDNEGNLPSSHALSRFSNTLYNTLVGFGMPPTEKMLPRDRIIPMEIDSYISLQRVEEDADAERKNMQDEKDSLMADGETHTPEDSQVDDYSNLRSMGYVVFLDEKFLNVMLRKIDISTYSWNVNMFYKMSVIYNMLLDVYILWTRWGSFGEKGMHQKTPFLTKEEAVAEFKTLFRSKTGNLWDEKDTNFVPKVGRYELMYFRNPNKYPILKSFDFNESCVKSTLPRNLKNTMRIVCDYEHLQKAYKRVHLDIHNGQVSQKSLDDALEMLDKIERLKEEFQKNYVRKPRHEREIEKKKLDKEIAELSTACYRILPRMSSQNGVIDSLKNEDHMSLEIAKIADLSYLNFAANVALAAKHHKSEIYPLDYVYQALGCSLQEITADGPSGREYNLIRNYMTSTSYKADYEITHLFSVDRQIERQRFSPFENNPNRKLLWHGSNVGNIVGILNQGLRCKPASADEHGSMFGRGIYFADMFCKSINYSNTEDTLSDNAYSILLLCEVALGEECSMINYYPHTFEKEKGHMSIKGLGKYHPDPKNTVCDESGMFIPLGPSVARTLEETSYINYDEYIVHDAAQVKIRYLVLVKNSKCCSLCQKSFEKSEIKPLKNYMLRNYDYSLFNEYETEILKLLLITTDMKLKQVFDRYLDEFIDGEEYLKKWNPLVGFSAENNTCSNCSDLVAAMTLMKYVESSIEHIPDDILNKPICKYGKECRTKENINHAKKYQHWLNEKKD